MNKFLGMIMRLGFIVCVVIYVVYALLLII